jgi:hypothetical protein
VDALDFSSQATPAELPDFSAQAEPVDSSKLPDFSDHAVPVESKEAPLTLGVTPIAANADLSHLLPAATAAASLPADPLDAHAMQDSIAAVPSALGRHFVGSGGAVLDAIASGAETLQNHPWLSGLPGALHYLVPSPAQAAGQAGIDQAREYAQAAHQFAGNVSDEKTVGGKVAAVAGESIAPLALALGAPEASTESLTAEAAPTLSKIPGLLKLARTVAAQSPRATTLTAIDTGANPNATPEDVAREAAINELTFGAPGAVGTEPLERMASGAIIGPAINTGATLASGQTPTVESNIFAALQGALGGGAAHAGGEHMLEPAAAPAKAAASNPAAFEDLLRKAGFEVPEEVPPQAAPAPRAPAAAETGAAPDFSAHAEPVTTSMIGQQWDAMSQSERAHLLKENGVAANRASQLAAQTWAQVEPGWQGIFEHRYEGLEPNRAEASTVPNEPIEYERPQPIQTAAAHQLAQASFSESDQAAQQEALEHIRAADASIAQEDHGDAITLTQWLHRARESGMTMDQALEVLGDGTMQKRVGRLARAVQDQEARNALGRPNQEPGEVGVPGVLREGQPEAGDFGLEADHAARNDRESAETRTSSNRPAQAVGDLLPPPTAQEHVRAAIEAKDAQRNGQTGRVIPDFFGTDLGATPHGEAPEQTGLPEARELSPDDLAPQERAAFDQHRAGVEVREHAIEDVPEELRQRFEQNPLEGERLARSRDESRKASRAIGSLAAESSGMRAAVEAAFPGHAIHFSASEAGLQDEMQARLRPLAKGRVRRGVFDPKTGEVHIFTKQVRTPEDAVWTAAHEIAGHKGIRGLVDALSKSDGKIGSVRIGGRAPTEALQKAMDLARQNQTVRAIADVIATQRNLKDRPLATEEALAELAAATRTGRFDEITRKYGVDIPRGVREGVQGAIRNFVARIKRILNALYAKATGKPEAFSDEQVHQLVADAWRAARDRIETRSKGAPLDMAEQDGAREDIRNVLEKSRVPGNVAAKARVAPAQSWLAALAKRAGLNIDGFNHVLDAYAARHIRAEHGGQEERTRGQVPVTDADFESLPEVVRSPEKVIFGTKNRIGRDQVGYLKRMPDGHWLYFEEARTGNRELAAQSLRKYPATMDAENVIKTISAPDLNARGDGGNGLIIEDGPSASKQDILESQEPAEPEPAPEPDKVLPRSFVSKALSRFIPGADEVASAVRMAAAPMAEGSVEARATAKDFANQMRDARFRGNFADTQLTKHFSRAQLEKMWNAADEQSVLEQKGEPTEGKGLDTLTPEERRAVEILQADARKVFDQARALGMVEGEGLPSYTPRMVVKMGDTGPRPFPDKDNPISGNVGRNVRTTTGQLKQRLHLTAEETEAAAKAKLGDETELVRNIRTLPLATAKLSEAVAGRSLINRIRDIGKQTGQDTVREGAAPDDGYKWFTLDHPAFKTWKPKQGSTSVDEGFDKHMMEGLEKLAEDLGVPHDRVAKIRGKAFAWGLASRDMTVKTRFAGPETVLTHELGHIIDYKYGLAHMLTRRGQSAKELRALADLRYEGIDDVPESFKQYVRKGTEKIANMVHAYVHMPDRFREVAPETFQRFNEFLDEHPELAQLRKIKPSLVLGSRTMDVPTTEWERVPIFVRGDFAGPLKAVLSEKNGAIYNGLMSLKGKTMSVIMYSPLIHNAVEWGRALPAMPGKVATFLVYFEGNRAKNDPVTMREAINAGLVPIGHNYGFQDISSIQESNNIIPGRSWTAKLLAAVPNLFDKRAGDAVKRAIDGLGDFWHNKLLWDRVGDLQMGLYTNFRDRLIRKGFQPDTAQRMAAHFANRYAGALPLEAMSNSARKIANLVLFSRSFTLGNLGAMKDMVSGLPRDVQSQILRDRGLEELTRANAYSKRKAISIIAADMALMYIGNSLLQSGIAVVRGTSTLDEEEKEYAERLWAALQAVKENPLKLLHPFDLAESLTPMSGNEPGKEDRVLIGHAPDGTAIYMRNPTGKIGEEFKGWLTSPLDMLKRKMGTVAKPLYEIMTNDQGFGRKVYDPYDDSTEGMIKNAGRIAGLFVQDQVPMQSINAVKDAIQGNGDTTTNILQAAGPLAGLTFSKGAPGGPAVGLAYQARDEHDFAVNEAMPGIRDMIRGGDTDKAVEKMQALGMPPSYIRWVIRTTINPSLRLSPKGLRDFSRYATPEQQQQMQEALGGQ